MNIHCVPAGGVPVIPIAPLIATTNCFNDLMNTLRTHLSHVHSFAHIGHFHDGGGCWMRLEDVVDAPTSAGFGQL